MFNTTLARTSHPKYTTYISDGAGRDQYILAHNGGLSNYPEPNPYQSSKFPSPPRRSQSPTKEATAFKYISDGNGRDTYILQASGGLHTPYVPGAKASTQAYIGSLRQNQKIERQKKNSVDFLNYQARFQSPNCRLRIKKKHKEQMYMSDRLACPKINSVGASMAAESGRLNGSSSVMAMTRNNAQEFTHLNPTDKQPLRNSLTSIHHRSLSVKKDQSAEQGFNSENEFHEYGAPAASQIKLTSKLAPLTHTRSSSQNRLQVLQSVQKSIKNLPIMQTQVSSQQSLRLKPSGRARATDDDQYFARGRNGKQQSSLKL